MANIPELNTLHYGDNLHIMRQWPNRLVDIVYGDPPFNSKQKYHQLYRLDEDNKGTRSASLKAFDDSWFWTPAAHQRVEELISMSALPIHKTIEGLYTMLGDCGQMAYLSYMALRILEMHRLLKDTGSLYLHCDIMTSHYIKPVLDSIFGPRMFRNEIIWSYHRFSRNSSKQFARMNDTIFFYTKSDDGNTFNFQYTEPRDATRYQKGYTTVVDKGVRKLLVYDMDKVKQAGVVLARYDKIVPTQAQRPLMGQVWSDIPILNSQSKERLGYDTQKPLALLERIIRASSNEGDVVLDPFCGCGTTIEAAHNLGRKWLGIDLNPSVLDVIVSQRLKAHNVPITGIPADFASASRLATDNRRHFEIWALNLIEGLAPNETGGADGGIDGKGNPVEAPGGDYKKLILGQVKSGKYSLSHLRDFLGVVQSENAVMGIYITLEALPPVAKRNAEILLSKWGEVQLGTEVFPRIQLFSVEEYFREGKLPRMPHMKNPYTGKPYERVLPLGL